MNVGRRTKVEIVNEQSHLKIDTKKVARLVRRVLRDERAGNQSVTVLITDDARIRSAHARFMGKNTPTDVIAFNAHRPTSHVPRPTENYLGDVIVSAETALREHHRYRSTAETEFMRYVVHGVLHLLGYRDKRPADFRKMHARQEKHLKGFGA